MTSMLYTAAPSISTMRGFFADVQTSFYNTVSAFLDTDIGGFFGTIVSGAAMAADGLLGIGGTALNVAAQLATFVAMTQQAGGVMSLLKSGATMVTSLFSGMGSIILGFGSSVFQALTAFGSGILAVARTIGSAMTAALGPVGIVIAAVIAIGTAAYQVYKHWDQIKAFFANLWEAVKGIFTSAFETITAGVTKFVNWVTTPFRWLADKIGGFLGWETDSDDIGEFIADADYTSEPIHVAEPVTATPVIEAGADMDAISAGMAKDIASFQTSVEGSIDTSGIDDLEADLNMGTSWAMPDNIIDFPTYGTDDTTWTQPAGWDQMVVDDGSAMQFQAPVVITSEESGSVLSAIRDIVDDIRTSVQNRKEGSTITIQSLSIPQTDDIEEAVRFIRDLREQIEREQTA